MLKFSTGRSCKSKSRIAHIVCLYTFILKDRLSLSRTICPSCENRYNLIQLNVELLKCTEIQYTRRRSEYGMKKVQFDYYHGTEAEQYTFYRVPKILFTDEYFKCISCEAKILYGLMLDRMSLSIKNQWFDEKNRA